MPDTAMDILAQVRWTLTRTQPGAARTPHELGLLDPNEVVRIPATVPGTAAGAWRDSFGSPAAMELDVDAWDWWFAATFDLGSAAVHTFGSDGIATNATLWLNGQRVWTGRNAFSGMSVEVLPNAGRNFVELQCTSLGVEPRPKTPRSRWRSYLISNDSIRWHRTPLLGHIPWAGTAKTAGPWAGLGLVRTTPVQLRSMGTTVDGALGTVHVEVTSVAPTTIRVLIRRNDRIVAETRTAVHSHGRVAVPVRDADRWYPATHGTPAVYHVLVTSDLMKGPVAELVVGFRTVQLCRRDGAFTVAINNQQLFVRGAVWAPLDPLTLGAGTQAYTEAIASLVSAGANMVRVSGTGAFEQTDFYDQCTLQGLLVWQDCMLATLDPPEDEHWLAELAAELDAVFPRLAHQPCLAVISGGNEVEQQPAMFGLEPGSYPMTALVTTIPDAADRHLPAIAQVSSSPSGSGSPMRINDGVSHYFGVGAYERGLEDARTAGVRFAAEALAFAVPAEPSSLLAQFGTEAPAASAGTAPAWALGTAQDPGAPWTFADTTRHYVQRFFSATASGNSGNAHEDELRRLDLDRAAVAHAMFETMVEWRRAESSCAGAMVLTARDLTRGPGFGLLDVDGTPKASWYAFRAASAPTAVAVVDEGLNGLDIHLFHDLPQSLSGTLSVTVHSHSGHASGSAMVEVDLPGADSAHWNAETILGGFRDYGHAWRFGAKTYDTMTVVLADRGGQEITRTTHLLGGPDRPSTDLGLFARFGRHGLHGQHFVDITTTGTASFVALDLPGFVPHENYFHMPPNSTRRVVCHRRRHGSGIEADLPVPIRGTVRALNDSGASRPVRTQEVEEIGTEQ